MCLTNIEIRLIYSSTRLIFNAHLGVWKCSLTRSFVFNNMKPIISSHNKHAVLSSANTPTQKPAIADCPVEGKFLQSSAIYQATVTTETSTETYVGLGTNFKERFRNHQTSFRHSSRGNEMEHFWTLQDAKKPFQIQWKALKKCKPYSNISEKCNLCLHEKFIIICKKKLGSLNQVK